MISTRLLLLHWRIKISFSSLLLPFIYSFIISTWIFLLHLSILISSASLIFTLFPAILMHGFPISNVFNFFRWRSYTFVLLNFRKQLWILNMCKIQKTSYLNSSDRMRIVFWKLRHTKHWVFFWVSIYNWNFNKASFSKQGRRGIINVRGDDVEPSSLLHFIYIKIN